MKINMKRLPLFSSINQIEEFLKTKKSSGLKVEIISNKDKYECISETLWNVKFRMLSKTDRHTVFRFLNFFTNYSISHLKRLSTKWRNGTLKYNPSRNRNKFSKKYFPSDIALLIRTDIAHGCFERECNSDNFETRVQTRTRGICHYSENFNWTHLQPQKQHQSIQVF